MVYKRVRGFRAFKPFSEDSKSSGRGVRVFFFFRAWFQFFGSWVVLKGCRGMVLLQSQLCLRPQIIYAFQDSY